MLLAIQIIMTVSIVFGLLIGAAHPKYWFWAFIIPPTLIVFTWIWPFLAILIMVCAGVIRKIGKLIEIY